jgi:hypothetical protein
MTNLPGYGTVKRCPKCGAPTTPGATTVYHAERLYRETTSEPHPPCALLPKTGPGFTEHQCRVCQTCMFGWCEAVLEPGPVKADRYE